MGRPTLSRHRKFRRLAAALGSRPLARGLVEQLWDAVYEAGDDFIGDSTDVEAAAGWEGAPGLLTKVLLEAGGDGHAGFIEEVPGKLGHYRVHDLWHHAPDYVRKRRQREEERRQKGDPVVPPTATRQTVTGDHPPHDGQQMPTPDCSDGVTFPPAPAPAPAPAPSPMPLALESEENKLDRPDGGDQQGSDDRIGEICNAHPRLQKPVVTEQYVIGALQEEIAHGKTFPEALDYLHERTRLYREMTDQWPEDQKRYIMSSHEFYRTAEYRTDSKNWKKVSNGEEHQNQRPAAMPEPASERIRKQLEAERQTAQTGNGGGSA